MEKVKLTDICRPKQWKTISGDEISSEGKYPVYGANGKMGFFHEYNHIDETLLIGCRGTCGTLHITEKFSYTNGNAMALDNLDKKANIKFLYYFFSKRGFNDVVSGGVQKQITIQNLQRIEIPLPNLATQQRIAAILDQADAIIQNNRAIVQKYDALTQSLFLDMFGDPVKNEKGWEKKEFSKVAINENSKRIPVKQSDRDEREGEYPYYGATGIIDTIDDYKFDGEYLLIAEDGKNLLFRKKNNAFMAYGKFWVNNHAHILSCNNICNLKYLEFFLNSIDLSPFISGIDQIKLNKASLDRIPVIVPPIELQNQFAERVAVIEAQKQQAQLELAKSEELFQSLLQRAFNGELS